jgi:hypothetical protein
MKGLSVASNSEHEAQVARFLEQCKQATPELCREVLERHIVLSERQMARRESTEIALSQLAGPGLRWWAHHIFYSGPGISEFDSEEG